MCICPPHLLGMCVHSCSLCVYMCACVFVSLTILEAHPQLLVVFFLHVVDDLALVLEGIGLLDTGHEMSLDHRAGQAVEQVAIWKVLTCRRQILLFVVNVKNVKVILYVNNNYNIYSQISCGRCRGKSFLWSRICIGLKMKVQNKAHTHTMKISKNKRDEK